MDVMSIVNECSDIVTEERSAVDMVYGLMRSETGVFQ